MWMLPRFQTNGSAAEPIHSSVFPFTNHQITLRVFGVGSDATGKRSLPSTLMPQAKTIWRSWMRTQDLANIPIPSPHRRAINACLSLDVGR
jgi:hypothetical protein